MRKFKFAKLIRDKILDNMIKNGQGPMYKILNDEEYLKELKKKVLEEAQEVPLEDGESLADKIADIQEVIEALLKTAKIKSSEIIKIRRAKAKERGVFKKRIYVKNVSTPENSKWLKYYLKFPQKYPEIK